MTATLTPAYVLRAARESDLGWLVGQLQQFADFYGTAHSLFFSESDVMERLPSVLALGPCFVVEASDGPVGFVAGVLQTHPYNPSIRVLSETFWWVTPSARGSRAGLMLLDAFNAYADRNADWVIFTLEHHSPVNERTLTKRGFHLHERAYLREVMR